MLTFYVGVYAQNNKVEEHDLQTYLTNIKDGVMPKNKNVQVNYKYIKLDRSFLYTEQIIKKYKYKDEVFDKLGFTRIDDNTFRRCKDNLFVYRSVIDDNTFMIKIEWYSDATKNGTSLMFCK